jgi:hypothetical protein
VDQSTPPQDSCATPFERVQYNTNEQSYMKYVTKDCNIQVFSD